MSLVDQLIEVYLEHESWHSFKLTRKDSEDYHSRLLSSGNIITLSDGQVLAGYVEFWRINFDQFGRIICGERFSPLDQDVTTGFIAYVANTFIRPEYRKSITAMLLRDRFFEVNKDCLYFCGTARRKSSEPVKVFRKDKIWDKTSKLALAQQ